jgi:hypothetical protein
MTMALEGIAQKTIKQMESEGRMITLSRESSARLDYEMAQAFLPIQQKSERKQRVSRAYISDVESGRINFYKPKANSVYNKIVDYFSGLFR